MGGYTEAVEYLRRKYSTALTKTILKSEYRESFPLKIERRNTERKTAESAILFLEFRHRNRFHAESD